MNDGFAAFKKKISNPIAFRAFLLTRLPLVYFTGIKIQQLTEESCTTTATYRWLNQNPFRSMYFAVMQMAAELSTGVLCMGNIYRQKPPVSMLVLKTVGVYHKKAVGKITFTCSQGTDIAAAILQARSTTEGSVIKCYSIAKNENGEMVGEFWITWSFKSKATS